MSLFFLFFLIRGGVVSLKKGGGVDGSYKIAKANLIINVQTVSSGFRPVLTFYPVRGKAKQFDQSSQGIHPVRLESSLCA